jgi:hypothetical protein
MGKKLVSDSQKRHYRTFHLARRNPELWEQERNASLSETLGEARERISVVEKEVETNKKLLRRSQHQVRLIFSERMDYMPMKPKG